MVLLEMPNGERMRREEIGKQRASKPVESLLKDHVGEMHGF